LWVRVPSSAEFFTQDRRRTNHLNRNRPFALLSTPLFTLFFVSTDLSAEKIESAEQFWSTGCQKLISQKSASDKPEDYTAIATCLLTDKKPKIAVDYLNRALKIRPNDPKILGLLGIAQGSGGGSLAEAGETLWRVAQLEPTKENLYLAAFYLQYGERFAQAVEPYRKLIALEPKDPVYLSSFGTCLSRSDKVKEADKVFADALVAVPGDASIEKEYALHLARQKRFEDAISHANVAVKSDPKPAESFNVLGQVFEMQGNKEKAAEAYESALKQDPEHSRSRIKLTRVRFNQNRYEDVIVNGLKVVKKSRDHREVHEMLLQAFEKTNQRDMAEQERQKLKEIDSQAAPVKNSTANR
jgi:tetratricopeptide (TPR) repeat protein